MSYDKSIDMSAIIKTDEPFIHDRVIITSRHSIFVRTGRVRPSLPYQGIARRSL